MQYILLTYATASWVKTGILHVDSNSNIQKAKKIMFIWLVVTKSTKSDECVARTLTTKAHPCTVDLDLQDTERTRSHTDRMSSYKLHTQTNIDLRRTSIRR